MRGNGLTVFCTIGGVVVGGCAMTHTSPQVSDTPAPHAAVEPEVLAAMQKLSWLRGNWDGKGMLGTPAGDVTQNGPWKIEPTYDGRYLRLEFDAVVDEGKSPPNRFVGYFTFDAAKKHYRTVWLNVDNLFQFHETGTLNDAGTALTLISEHKRPDGTIGRVRSVFTKVDDTHVTCEDHRLNEKNEPIKKTFGFALTRR